MQATLSILLALLVSAAPSALATGALVVLDAEHDRDAHRDCAPESTPGYRRDCAVVNLSANLSSPTNVTLHVSQAVSCSTSSNETLQDCGPLHQPEGGEARLTTESAFVHARTGRDLDGYHVDADVDVPGILDLSVRS